MKQTEIKQRKEPGSNGQYYVVVRKKKEWEAIFNWLIENGFTNVHNLTKRKRPQHPPAIVIDIKRHTFGLINVCCLSAGISCGYFSITCEEFYKSFYNLTCS